MYDKKILNKFFLWFNPVAVVGVDFLTISVSHFLYFHSFILYFVIWSFHLFNSILVFLFFPDMSVITTGGYVSRHTSCFVFFSSNFFLPFLWFTFYHLFVFQILALIHSTELLLFYFFLIFIIHVVFWVLSCFYKIKSKYFSCINVK